MMSLLALVIKLYDMVYKRA